MNSQKSKELEVSNKEVIKIANQLGIPIKSHTSSVSKEDAKKIRKKFSVSQNDGKLPSRDEAQKPSEEVKVVRLESGVEVVVRRKGGSVIIRKKKKEESMPEASPIIERDDDKPVEKTELTSQLRDAIEKPEEIKEIKTTKSEPALGSDTEQVFTESIEEFAETELPSEEELEKAVEVEKVKEEVVEKIKKKVRKLKPKKEEIIDEDTLEELRKAFKTKLPGRKREYLVVEDRRSRMRPYSDAQNRGKASARVRKETTKDAGISQEDSIIAEVIPFPAKPTKKIIKVGESITVGELAKKMGVKAASLIKKLMELGANYTINQSMDPEIVTIAAAEFFFFLLPDYY